MFSSVVLPQPDGPSTESNSPASSFNVTSFSACTELPLGRSNRMERFSMDRPDAATALSPFPVSRPRVREGRTRGLSATALWRVENGATPRSRAASGHMPEAACSGPVFTCSA